MITGIIINHLIALVTGGCIRYIPLKSKLRVPVWALLLIYGAVFSLQSLVLVLMHSQYAPKYLDGQLHQTLSGFLTVLLPFFFIRKSFFQNLFLVAIVANYSLIVIGAGNYAELALSGTLVENSPYLLSNTVKIALSALTLPLVLWALKKLFALWPEEKSLIWRMNWIVPTLFAVLCFMAFGFYHGTETITTISFFAGRIVVGAGCVATCFLVARAFRQEAQNAAMQEHARMTEQLLRLQREQYTNLSQNMAQTKAARHDLRHQLSVLSSYQAQGDLEGLGRYLQKLTDALPAAPEQIWCENYAVNAIAAHYLAMAQAEGIALDVHMDIPAQTGGVPDIDLCVIVGNLLENALEACRRMTGGERFIRVVSRVQKKEYLSLLVENSFDGLWREKDGVYYSRKRGADRAGGVSREGVGLSSVQAVCDKHDGLLRVAVEENMFKTSVLLGIGGA